VSSGVASFKADLDAFARFMDMSINQAIQKIVAEIFTRIVKKTPYDTGNAKANWNVSLSVPDTSVQPFTGASSAAENISLARLNKILPGIRFEQAIFLTNAVSYIIYLERGWSKQAPAGMVAVSLAEVEAFIINILRGN
jgi:hypothetical protein